MELPSDSDESDVDYVPEDDDGDCKTENLDGSRKKQKEKRASREAVPATRSKRARMSNETREPVGPQNKELNHSVDKKHEDDLWASFLSSPTEVDSSQRVENSDNETVSTKVVDENHKEIIEADNKLINSKPTTLKKPGGGLSSVLNKLGKNSKLSTLEKSKLDWNSFKKDEGIEEELTTFNRGRDGYLERQDFLQRTDLRQFEIEKNIRTVTRRSNR